MIKLESCWVIDLGQSKEERDNFRYEPCMRFLITQSN